MQKIDTCLGLNELPLFPCISICLDGKLKNCLSHSCPETCTILGGHSFRTFDGKMYNLEDKCEYALVQTMNDDDPSFSIYLDKSMCRDKGQDCPTVPSISVKTPDGSIYE